MPSTQQLLEKRQYYGGGIYGPNTGLSSSARIGIGVGAAVLVVALVLIFGAIAKQRGLRHTAAMQNQNAAYAPQTGYGGGYGAQQNYGQHGAGGYNGGYPEPQGHPGSYGYPPPQGPPPSGQPEMVDGNPYAPPTAPPPAYNASTK